MKISKITTPLLWRVVIFLCLFVVISGVIGPRIISGGILLRDGFAFYGGLGKAAMFAFIAFILLARRHTERVNLQPWVPQLLVWSIASFVSLLVAWAGVTRLIEGERTWLQLLLAHLGILLGVSCAFMSCFGIQNLKILWDKYKRELRAAAIIGIAFYIFLTVVYTLWKPLASVVLTAVVGLLNVTGLHTTILPPNTLMFDKFGITVAEFCSGIESIALFTGLYIVVGLLDWHRLNKWRYFILFPFALLLLCGFNIVRVYGLIMAGYYIDPEIAFSLFHTYAGMVFFILYSAVFWAVAYKYLMRQKKERKS